MHVENLFGNLSGVQQSRTLHTGVYRSGVWPTGRTSVLSCLATAMKLGWPYSMLGGCEVVKFCTVAACNAAQPVLHYFIDLLT